MKQKKTGLMKWVAGVIIALMIMAIGTHQGSSSTTPRGWSSALSSPADFFSFLASCFDFGGQNSPMPRGSSQANPLSNRYNSLPGQMEGVSLGQEDQSSTSGPGNSRTLRGRNPSEEINNPESTSGTNSQESTGTDNNDRSAYDPGDNAESDLSSNADSSTDSSQDDGSGTNAAQEAGNSTTNSSEDSSTGNSTNDNADSIFNESSDDSSGGSTGGDSGDNLGNNPGNNSNSNSAGNNQPIGPTINPIPTNDNVAQSIANQNQGNNLIDAQLIARQALVAPIQQEAQATKYQTVNTQNISVPNMTPPSEDILQKIKSKQLFPR